MRTDLKGSWGPLEVFWAGVLMQMHHFYHLYAALVYDISRLKN